MNLQRAVPEWSARPTTEVTYRTDAARLHDTEPMEFILSSNWALKPEGLDDFYELLYRHDENLEVQYDYLIHGFRVKCSSYNEVKVVSLVKDSLDQLVKNESGTGLVSSHVITTKVATLEDWRKNDRPGEKVKLPSKYSFPRDIAMCDTRTTWKIPGTLFEKGIITDIMLPESALFELQKLTGAVIVASSDRRTVYVGASRTECVTVVKRKLDTLARFFSLVPKDMTQVVEIFLYSEGDGSTKGEYRYVADGNDKLLRSYILDHFDWPWPNRRYPTIFKKGVLVRLNPNNIPWEEAQSLSDGLLPIAKEERAREEFGAFRSNNWKYRAKDAVFRSSDISTTHSGSKQITHQHIIRPAIEDWVSGLPIPNLTKKTDPGSTLRSQQSIPRDRALDQPMKSRYRPDNISSSAAFEPHQVDKPCPFALLWQQYRQGSPATTSTPDTDQNDRFELQAPLPAEAVKPRLSQNNESDSRSFHRTMNQKAGSRKVQKNIFPEFDPNMFISINKLLADLMAPLRMWSGIVDFRIELGRFYFLNVKESRIQDPGDDDDEKHYPLNRIRAELNKRHKANERLFFTRVLSSLGADANHIAQMSDDSGNPMWRRPIDGRSSTFEFICRRTLHGAELNFIVEIDTANFSQTVKQFKPDQNCFMVHCTKRVWDFRLVLSASQDLDDIYHRFAEDLASSLRVIPNDNDRLPELEVSYNKSYNVEILVVRTRNQACCIHEVSTKKTCSIQANPRQDVQQLYISEVWEMGQLSISEVEQCIHHKFARYKDDERPKSPSVWYEAVLKSDTFSKAFKQNGKLELGNEVAWTSEELIETGYVEELIRKAAKMVTNMDGVGFWNDNHQVELHGVVAVGKPKKNQDPVKFW
ncbi:hypothetical protein F4678DRAFT_479339 [Xylaria arbuscula]|nr:hypothetical protein F4678DRAFT_479339 [Xylaria arbuscula]